MRSIQQADKRDAKTTQKKTITKEDNDGNAIGTHHVAILTTTEQCQQTEGDAINNGGNTTPPQSRIEHDLKEIGKKESTPTRRKEKEEIEKSKEKERS